MTEFMRRGQAAQSSIYLILRTIDVAKCKSSVSDRQITKAEIFRRCQFADEYGWLNHIRPVKQ